MLAQKTLAATLKPDPVLQWHQGSFNITTASSYTYSLNIGTASAYRYVVVGVTYRIGATTNPALPTLTVAGQSTSIVVFNGNTATSSSIRVVAAIYRTVSPVTTGTSATVILTSNSDPFTRSFVSAYSLTYPGVPDVLETANPGDTGTNPVTLSAATKTTSNVGLVIASGATSSSLTGISASGPITTNYNSGSQSNGALLTGTVTGTGTITITTTGTGSNVRTAMVVWG